MGHFGGGGRRGGGGRHRVVHHHHHRVNRFRGLRRHPLGFRRRIFHRRRWGFRRRYYGHYWGYNPYCYGGGYGYNDGCYVTPALHFQVQQSKQPPSVKFKEYRVQIVREAVMAPSVPQTFNVQVPAGVAAGQQIVVTNPFDGQRLLVNVPAGLAPGAVFQVASTAQQQPQQPQQPGAAVGQLVPIDTNGDGINDSFGVLHDVDGDGIPDAIAVDYNNDGIVDQYIPYTAPGGQQAGLKVTKAAPTHLVVTAPANAPLTLKVVVDAVETFLEGELTNLYTNQQNVEDLDFTAQFVKLSDQHQWINGKYHGGSFQPPTLAITVPAGAKPGQVIQVAPPPGYDQQNQMIPVTLPNNATPGMRLSVALPAVEPDLPVATEVGNPNQVAPAGDPQSQEWQFPASQGMFESALAACNNTFIVRGVETVAFAATTNTVEVSGGAPRRCCMVAVIIVFILIVIGVIVGASLSAATGGNGYYYDYDYYYYDYSYVAAFDYSRGDECTYPYSSTTPVCWDKVSWNMVDYLGYQDEWQALGWTQSKWRSNDYSGTASDKYWSQLTEDQLLRVQNLGFTSSNWLDGGISIS